MYAQPHSHSAFPDHVPRVEATIKVGNRLLRRLGVNPMKGLTVGDMSTGDAAIPNGIAALLPGGTVTTHLGDFAPGYPSTGPLADTLADMGPVDVYVLCETLEHVDNPGATLRAVRGKAASLLMSTPVDNWDDDNPEHIWSWSKEDLDGLLMESGWVPAIYEELDMRAAGFPYKWGIWGCL